MPESSISPPVTMTRIAGHDARMCGHDETEYAVANVDQCHHCKRVVGIAGQLPLTCLCRAPNPLTDRCALVVFVRQMARSCLLWGNGVRSDLLALPMAWVCP